MFNLECQLEWGSSKQQRCVSHNSVNDLPGPDNPEVNSQCKFINHERVVAQGSWRVAVGLSTHTRGQWRILPSHNRLRHPTPLRHCFSCLHALHPQKKAILIRYKSRTVLYRGNFGDWATINTSASAGSSPFMHAGHHSRAHSIFNSLPVPFCSYSLLPQHCRLLSTVSKRQPVRYAAAFLQKHFSTHIRCNNAHFNLWDAEA